MSLQLILGNSGAGKSHLLFQEIIEKAIENPDTNYIVIVPEQFTMATQKELVSMHPNHAIINIDVLSFQRLAYRIFEEVGKKEGIVLEDTGKNLVLRKIAFQKQEQLQILKGNINKLGYISEVKSMISELVQYDISPGKLEEIVCKEKVNLPFSLKSKLNDVLTLYQGFQEFIDGKYITAEEILEVLSQVIGESDLVKNSVIALDGFTGFTPIQNKLLEKFLSLAKMLVVTITIDVRENPYFQDEDFRLFHLSKRTIYELKEMAKSVGVEQKEDIILGKDTIPRFLKAPALAWLEQNLFRYEQNTYLKKQDEISIHITQNPQEEVRFVGKEINRLVREEGYRYKDIAIVTGDIGLFSNYVESIFQQYEIPCFLDYKKSVLYNPFIEYIRSALQVMEQNFSYESIFRYLKSDLAEVKMEDVDLLENYILATGIRGQKAWNRKWVRLVRGYTEADLVKLNQIREIIQKQFQIFVETFQKKVVTVKEQTVALYQFIVEREIQKQLKEKEEFFKNQGDNARAKEYGQIYKAVMELLEKLVELLGEERISLKEFQEILDAGLAEVKIGIIPPGYDRVVIGDIERTRLNHIRVLFFIGVNDGIIPGTNQGGGIISQLEREHLAENKVRLAPTARERVYTQRFYLYINMTKPEEKLYLTCSKLNGEGKSVRKSYLIGTLLKMFPHMTVQEEEKKNSILKEIVTPRSSIDFLVESLREFKEYGTGEESLTLFAWYQQQPEWQDKMQQLLEAVFYQRREDKISQSVATELYGKVLESSVTRLEEYASCAFSHFLTYGLRLKERLEYQFAAVDMGNIFHESLEIYSKKIVKGPYTWFDIPKEEQLNYIKDSVDEAVLANESNILFSNARNEYMITRIKRILERSVWALGEQIRHGSFQPSNYEVSFSSIDDLKSLNISLTEKEKIKLRGRIDRLDTYEDEEHVYIKVIDYKSGNTKFDLLSLYYGLQLQLVLYMNAAVELKQKENPQKEVLPAGIFYYNLKDPILEKEGVQEEEKINQRILEELCVNGLVNDDSEVIEHLDHQFVDKSMVIPVKKNKDGSLSKISKIASRQQFQILSDYVDKKIKELGQEILQGNATCNPYQMKQKDSCTYCHYGAICGQDTKMVNHHLRRLKELTVEEIWIKMKEEV